MHDLRNLPVASVFGFNLIPQYSAAEGQGDFAKGRSLHDLSFDCRQLYAVYADYPAGRLGLVAFSAFSWGLALLGIVQELTIGRKSEKRLLSMVIYVLMGWLIVVAVWPLIKSLSAGGLFLAGIGRRVV